MADKPTPADTPRKELLNGADAARLLGVSRTWFWKLRKEFGLKRVPWSSETRPLYRLVDVLKLADGSSYNPAYLTNSEGQPLYGLDFETGEWHMKEPIPRK